MWPGTRDPGHTVGRTVRGRRRGSQCIRFVTGNPGTVAYGWAYGLWPAAQKPGHTVFGRRLLIRGVRFSARDAGLANRALLFILFLCSLLMLLRSDCISLNLFKLR